MRQNLFGQGPRAGRESQPGPGGYSRPPQPPPRDDTPMRGYDDQQGGYADPKGSYGAPVPPPRGSMPSRPAVGRTQPTSPARRIQLRIAKVSDYADKTLESQYIFGNL
jgi:vesicle-fusing ATPase